MLPRLLLIAVHILHVPLPCSSVMFGIVDEHDVLEESEVLVCNGRITGDVLVLRAPCVFPGDVQKATAVPRKPESAFACLDQVIVFSSKGGRPMTDRLGGGDLDGDKYFVVCEQELVQMATPALPHDFGTQNPNVKEEADIATAFCAPSEHAALAVPAVEDQLRVLGEFTSQGNLVSHTADAWLRMADKLGVANENVQRLAALHQRKCEGVMLFTSRKLELHKSHLPSPSGQALWIHGRATVTLTLPSWRSCTMSWR